MNDQDRITQLEAACASSMLTFARFAEMIFRHEQNLQGVRSEQTTGGLPEDDPQSGEGLFSEPVQEVQSSPLHATASERSQAQGAQGDSLAKTKVEGPGEVSGILQKVSQASPGKPTEGSTSSGPVQSQMPHRSDECGCIGKGAQTEAMSGVRMDGPDSWAPRRLQQALRRGVALRYLSREEAQEVLKALSPDAGKSLLEKYQYHLTDNQRLKGELERVCDRLQAVEKEHIALRLAAEELVTYVRYGDQEDIGEAMGKIESILKPKQQ